MTVAVAEPKAKAAHVWARDPFDWYVEPASVTAGLLRVESFVGRVWDPACGQGNIVRTLVSAGYQAAGTDLVQRDVTNSFPWRGSMDFLTEAPLADYPNIVTNPPFGRAKTAEAFIRRALLIATGKVVVFVDIRLLAGVERAKGLFAVSPPTRIWIVTPRVSCPPGDFLRAGGKAGNGSSDWCWLVWDMTAPRRIAPPALGWLRLDTNG